MDYSSLLLPSPQLCFKAQLGFCCCSSCCLFPVTTHLVREHVTLCFLHWWQRSPAQTWQPLPFLGLGTSAICSPAFGYEGSKLLIHLIINLRVAVYSNPHVALWMRCSWTGKSLCMVSARASAPAASAVSSRTGFSLGEAHDTCDMYKWPHPALNPWWNWSWCWWELCM